MASGTASHVISREVSFLFHSGSFFIEKEENHLFENILLSFIVVHIAVYFACSRKKEKLTQIHMSLFAKSLNRLTKCENGILTLTTNTEFTEN